MSVRVRILDIMLFINFMITHYFERKRRTQKGKVKSKIAKNQYQMVLPLPGWHLIKYLTR